MTTAQFLGNPTRYDPYKNFRFKIKWDGNYVAGISNVSGVSHGTQPVTHRGGGDPSVPRLSPDQTANGAITLEQGVTHDAAFEQWANKVWDYKDSTGTDANASLNDSRKDIVIELYNEAGQIVLAYNVYRCWVSEFSALPELNAMGDAIAIQTLKLENEGWDRVETVGEPAPPSGGSPAS
jgi:phage tail-like protein